MSVTLPRRPAATLMTFAVPVASVLSFMVQPLLGKRLLPIYGGGADTWLGTMVYFQMALLVGYAWATWLLTRRPHVQRWATLILAGVALLSFRMPASDSATGGILHIVGVLSLHSLPAMVLLFSVSPLMHGWLRRRGEGVPYHIYALSNFGNLVGLLAYPFLIETTIGLTTQRWLVHGGIAVVTTLIAGATLLEHREDGAPTDHGAEPGPAAEATRPREVLAWVGLSLLTCATMLGATELLASELGSSPLAWVGPFAAYLLSFMVAFAGKCRGWMMPAAATGLILGLTGFMFEKGLSLLPLAGPAFFYLILAVGCACFIGNAMLYRLRPAVRFDRYYLALAAGGVAGGLVVSLVIPYVLARPVEFLVGSSLLYLGAVWPATIGTPARRVLALLALVPALGLGYFTARLDGPNATSRHLRNEYGHVAIRTTTSQGQSKVELLSESTVHGSQLHLDPTSARRPTQYYTESGGVGRMMLYLQRNRPAMRIGVIGLGAGTLAAYGRPGDEIRFWDIDPKIIEIANRDFSYLHDSLAKVEARQEDGRRALATSTEDYDLIVVDGFSGDSVPAHLVTVEALQAYLARLSARKGALVIHVSSRYNEPFEVLSQTALAAGRQAVAVTTFITGQAENKDWDASDTEFLIIPPPDLLSVFAAVYPETEDNGRVRRKFLNSTGRVLDPKRVWTDDRHAMIEILNVRSFLTWRNRQ